MWLAGNGIHNSNAEAEKEMGITVWVETIRFKEEQYQRNFTSYGIESLITIQIFEIIYVHA